MLINKNEYKISLTELWHEVFADSYDFIEHIFKPEYDGYILCFAELDGDKAVSAFYLIRNTLKFEGVFFEGFYLYAAATLPEYRKSGIMAKLIREAQLFCRENNFDFISLVPSDEGLYSYYSRFGFEAAMYRCENSAPIQKLNINPCFGFDDTAEILEIRNAYEGNIISFHPATFAYACDCLKYSDFEFRRISEMGYLLCSDEDDFAEILLPKKENADELPALKENITSPYALEQYSACELKPFGMLYPINPRLIKRWKYTDIYMNIALD